MKEHSEELIKAASKVVGTRLYTQEEVDQIRRLTIDKCIKELHTIKDRIIEQVSDNPYQE